MRGLVIATLDVVAYLVLIAATVVGALSGMTIASNPYVGAMERALAPIFGTVAGFVVGVLVAGGVLVLTEIARNSRRTVELLERLQER